MSNSIIEARDTAIVNLVKDGHSYREIARLYKLSHQRIHQIFRKHRPAGTKLSPTH